MKHGNTAVGLLTGAVLGLLCGIPLGRHLERAGLAWWLTRLSLRTAWDSALSAAGWILLAAVLLGGAVALLVRTVT